MSVFNTENPQTLIYALIVLASILDDQLAEKIRQVGGITLIAKLPALPFALNNEMFARFLLFVDLKMTNSGLYFISTF